ncbi:hypothetical protein B7494_g3060 [Chlorociboria aeruginascens]|nr:hypothetical protein B7494_g3060 [Chlorociboria aeruginascens]
MNRSRQGKGVALHIDKAPSSGFKATARPGPKRRIHTSQTHQRIRSNREHEASSSNLRSAHEPRKFIIGIDYGTTLTKISYLTHPIGQLNPQAFPWEVKTIRNWPYDTPTNPKKQVPSESWYSHVPLKRAPAFEDDAHGDFLYDLEENFHPLADRPNDSTGSSHSEAQSNADENAANYDNTSKYLWGYAVPRHQFRTDLAIGGRSSLRLIKRAKLMLVDTSYTGEEKVRLRRKIDQLVKQGMILNYSMKDKPDSRDVIDIITDFLVKALGHTKKQLELLEGLTDKCEVEYALTVPAVWTPEASRILQTATRAAIRATGFGNSKDGIVDDIFIVSEPEAAATFLLANTADRLLPNEVFIIADCGGGTVDMVTYGIDQSWPLRLKDEKVPPRGDNCGSSYLNENYRAMLLRRLQDETYLTHNGESMGAIVNRLIPAFENDIKRNVDMTKECGLTPVYISQLKGDQQQDLFGTALKRFSPNLLLVDKSDFEEIFHPLLQRIERLLEEQIILAQEKDLAVKKVFLIGGFGESPSLQNHLRKFLAGISSRSRNEIQLITSIKSLDKENSPQFLDKTVAVSSGAVLRALNKDNGPDRIAQASYGLLHTEVYDRKSLTHRYARPEPPSELDGEVYVKTIVYFMVKNKLIKSKHKFETFDMAHEFAEDEDKFICEELLFASDSSTESNYAREDIVNKDAQLVGSIVTDMTFLRDQGLIELTVPDAGEKGKPRWVVIYDLVVEVHGKNLKYFARYPPGPEGTIRKSAQLSIAAAFRPGTA